MGIWSTSRGSISKGHLRTDNPASIGYGSSLGTLQSVPRTWDDAQEGTILCSTSGSEKLVLMSLSGHSVVRSFDSWRDKLLLRCEVDWQWEMKTSPIEQDRQWSLSEAKSNRTPVALKWGDCEAQLYSAWRYRRMSLRLFSFGMRSYIQENMSELQGNKLCGNNKAV